MMKPAGRSVIALIHVHGMGDQWRTEETSDLLAGLDDYLLQFGPPGKARLKIEARVGPDPLPGTTERLNVLTTTLPLRRPDGTLIPDAGPELRVYEVYWAPLAGDGPNELTVLQWIRALWVVPFLRLTTPWRRLPRLRRASLRELYRKDRARERVASGGPPVPLEAGRLGAPLRKAGRWGAPLRKWGSLFSTHAQPHEYRELLRFYEAFGRDEACKVHKRGSFQQFIEFLETTPSRLPPGYTTPSSAMIALAHRWHLHATRTELKGLLAILSLVLLTLVLALTTVESINALVKTFQDSTSGAYQAWTARYFIDTSRVVDRAFVWPVVILTVVTTLVYFLLLRRFLSRSLGDVLFWATYHETESANEKRSAILARARAVLERVLTDPTVDEVVITAHSLGSVIAHDALLQSRHTPTVAPFIRKVKWLFTYGSPIDKFAYLFEAQQARSRRYETVVESLRGDVFANLNVPPDFRWLNFYEAGDSISGAIDTAGVAVPSCDQEFTPVRNIYCPNAVTPTLLRNHGGYRESRVMISRLWRALVPEVVKQVVVSEETSRRHALLQRTLQVFILAIPWVLLSTVLLHASTVINMKYGGNVHGLISGVLLGTGMVMAVLAGLFVRVERWNFVLVPACGVLSVLSFLTAGALLSRVHAGVLERTASPTTWWLLWGAFLVGSVVPLVLLQVATRVLRSSPAHARRARLGWLAGCVVLVGVVALHASVASNLMGWWWWRIVSLMAAYSLILLALWQLIVQLRTPSRFLFRSTDA